MRYIRIIFVMLVIFTFSCTNQRSNDSSQQDAYDYFKDIESLSSEEHTQLAGIFTGSMQESIDSLMKIYKKQFRFNGSVLVAYHGMIVYHKTFGYSKFSPKEELKKEDPFQLASVSKQFTAAAIMMLEEDGLLSYSDSVTKHIPEFPFPRVTIEQLLHHTAGMPNYMWLLEHKWDKERGAYNDDIIRLMNEHKSSLYFRPGSRYDYSNTGYAILAALVERIADQPFADYVRENIFLPLGMMDSFVYSKALSRMYPEKVTGYYRKWRAFNPITETIHDGIVGDKGVYSTAEDLFKWDQALYTERLISKETQKRAFTPLKVKGRWEYPYGYGFRIKKVDGKKVVYHTGLWEGFRTNLMRYVEDRNTIIVLNNTNANVNNVLIKRIEKILKRDLEVTPTQEIVDRTLKEGVKSGMHLYLKYKRKGKQIDVKKILFAAEFLSSIDKPIASSALIEMYQQIVSTMTLEEKTHP